MGLIIPLAGSQKARARVSKFPSYGLKIPLDEGRSNDSSGLAKHAVKGQRTGLELIGGEIERGGGFVENNRLREKCDGAIVSLFADFQLYG